MVPDHAQSQFLSEVSQASKTCKIVTSNDIYDHHDIKLWGRDQEVSESLKKRLLARNLREPLESCLRAENGVTTVHIYEEFKRFLSSNHALAPEIKQYEGDLDEHVRSLPLHPAIQLLLTVGRTNRPKTFSHAIQGMALAGAMALYAGTDRAKVRLAMLAGLLHDIGEIYIDPQYLDATKPLNATTFRHLAAHPILGANLIKSLTDYPPAVAQAIAQHHERLDGTGYPAARSGKEMSELGRMLAVVETTLGTTDTDTDTDSVALQRSSFTLRMVPGEYDPGWVGFVARAATAAQARHPIQQSTAALQAAREASIVCIEKISASHRLCVAAAEHTAGNSAAVRQICKRAAIRLLNLDVASRSMGIPTSLIESSPLEVFEQVSAARELNFRLKKIRCECLWSITNLSQADQDQLAPIWLAMADPDASELCDSAPSPLIG